jgi:glycosyltransferase involved in cell wall biosynthesis
MRILQVHNRYRSASPSGENRIVDLEAANLSRRGHEVEKFQRWSDEIETWSTARRALLPGRVVWNRESYRAIVRVLRDSRPDVVHVHNVFPIVSSSVLYACAREHVPVVATLHNYRLVCPTGELFRDGTVCHDCVGHSPLPAIRHACYRGSSLATVPIVMASEVQKRAMRRLVSAFVCLSRSQRDLLAPFGWPEDRVFVKYNLAPFDVPARDSSMPRDTIVFAGRLDRVKGIPLLMEGWDRYAATSGERALRLVVAGTGQLQNELETWAADRPDVEVLGLVSPDKCRALMAAARAVVVSSQWEEPFGLVVAEAMAAGVPVIAPEFGSFPELVNAGKEGVLFPPGDAEGLAHALHEVESFPGRFLRYGRNARAAYESRFDPDTNIDQLVSIYEFAIRNPVWNTLDQRTPPGSPDPVRSNTGPGYEVASQPLRGWEPIAFLSCRPRQEPGASGGPAGSTDLTLRRGPTVDGCALGELRV